VQIEDLGPPHSPGRIDALIARLPGPLQRTVRWALDHSNAVMFVAGFLFDVVTIQRIDSRMDLAVQLLYLVILAVLLIAQHREAIGAWTPPPRVQRWWHHNVEALHFFYGGLLSAFVILYFRSSTGARPLIFFLLLVALFFLNEVPQVRKAGHRLRLGLYAFCLLSFFNYFVPIVAGRIGGVIFLISLAITLAMVWWLADVLARRTADRPRERLRLFTPAAIVCGAIALFYALKLIPPVPLSVTFQGIYHDVQRHGSGYTLTYEKASGWMLWRSDSRPFRARSGDRIFYFMRVFAPTRFSETIFTRWEYQQADGRWRTTDRIELPAVRGGSDDGFRTFARKSTYQPGNWRVTAETEDGRALATISFRVDADTATDERQWATRES
jgi:hypothetical protein